jgi:hypothetical protein
MTQQRRDSHSTEFGIWLREVKEIDSSLGFVATNIDYMWTNYKTGAWMFIEEKRHGAQVKFPQNKMFEIVDKACKADKNYKGLHVLIFQNTSPDDGRMWLDGKEINVLELVRFLRFEN